MLVESLWVADIQYVVLNLLSQATNLVFKNCLNNNKTLPS